jgi:hypothetical protein
MCNGILLKLPDGREMCIPLYVEINPFDDDPDPRGLSSLIDIFSNPASGPLISREIVKDIVILATMNRLTAQLSPEMQSAVQPMLQDVARRQQLPDGMRVELTAESAQT